MKKLVKIIRISAKEWFKKLRKEWLIYCSAINKKFSIWNIFLNHISWSSIKKRSIREIIERLSIINLVEGIALEWVVVEERGNLIFEKTKYFVKSYKILLEIRWVKFYLIIWEKKNWDTVLISCFLKNKTK